MNPPDAHTTTTPAPPPAADARTPARAAVLILATAFPPDPISGAARPGRFARYLPRFGYDPIVVCLRGPGQPPDSEAVRRVPGATPDRRTRSAASLARLVQRFLLPYDDSLPWAAHALAEAERVLASRPVAAVLSTSPPAATHLVALRLKRRHGLPWVADFRDPLLGNPFRSRRWFFPYDSWLQSLLFGHADALIANTDAVAELWRRRDRRIDRKAHVIWNGYDPEEAVEALPTAGPRRVLAHVGTLYGARYPGRLLGSLARLIECGRVDADRILVRLVGPSDDPGLRTDPRIVAALRARGCLEFDGKGIPQAEARLVASRADFLLLIDLDEREAGLQVPAKIFEYIRIGRPILAYTRKGSPTHQILQGSGVPHRLIFTDATDPQADDQVAGLLDLPSDPTPPSDWFLGRFDGRDQARALAEILDAARGPASTTPGPDDGPLNPAPAGGPAAAPPAEEPRLIGPLDAKSLPPANACEKPPYEGLSRRSTP